jgi:saccharopine dehydrogenase (NADP+, L-glutamate forming)
MYCLATSAIANDHRGYKFSWSPRGVLLALKNDAKYLEDGKEVHIRGDELMASAREYKSGYQGFHFVSYANRISTNYRER